MIVMPSSIKRPMQDAVVCVSQRTAHPPERHGLQRGKEAKKLPVPVMRIGRLSTFMPWLRRNLNRWSCSCDCAIHITGFDRYGRTGNQQGKRENGEQSCCKSRCEDCGSQGSQRERRCNQVDPPWPTWCLGSRKYAALKTAGRQRVSGPAGGLFAVQASL